MRKKICCLLLIGSCGTLFSQINYFQSSGTSNFSTGQSTVSGSYVKVGQTAYQIDLSAEQAIHAKTEIEVQDGFAVDNLTGSGSATLEIRPNMELVSSFHPNGFTGIPMYSRFEVGVRFPDLNVFGSVANFLNAFNYNTGALTYNYQTWTTGTLPQKLNPYDPDAIRMECTFWRPSNPTQTFVRNGYFNSQKITVDANDTWISSNREVYYQTAFMNQYYVPNQINSPSLKYAFDAHFFHFRFAPPSTGQWMGKVKLYIGNQLYFEYESFSFFVVISNEKGHLSVDQDPEILKFKHDNGDYFFGVGRDIAYPENLPERWQPPYTSTGLGSAVMPQCGSVYNAGWELHTSAVPSSFDFHRQELEDLGNNGGNFVRMRFNGYHVPFERPTRPDCTTNSIEFLNNYYPWEKYHSEFDNTLATCEDKGLYILLTLYDDPLGGDHTPNVGGWEGANPYSQVPNPNNATGRMYWEDFLTNPTLKQIFKKRLYYIEARWGYSTKIAAWELFNEIESLQKPINGLTDSQIRDMLSQWSCEMRQYLRSNYPAHLVTNGTMQPAKEYATAFNNQRDPNNFSGLSPARQDGTCLDFMTEHRYVNEFEFRLSQLPPNYYVAMYNVLQPDYVDPEPLMQDLSSYNTGYWHQANNTTYNNHIPVLFGEHGLDSPKNKAVQATDSMAIPGFHNYSPFTFHNENWASVFNNGLTIALQWHDWAIPGSYHFAGLHPFTKDFKPLREFVEKINFNVPLLPDRNSLTMAARQSYTFTDENEFVHTYWLVTKTKDKVYGWTRNTSANLFNDAIPAMISDAQQASITASNSKNKFGIALQNALIANYNFDVNNVPIYLQPLNMTQIMQATVVQGLLANEKYDITVYNTWDPALPVLQTLNQVMTDVNGKLRFGLDMLCAVPNSNSTSFPDYAFIAELSSGQRTPWQETSSDSVTVLQESTICFEATESESSSKHSWITDEGQGAKGNQPCLNFINPGIHTVKHEEYVQEQNQDKQILKVEEKKFFLPALQRNLAFALSPVPASNSVKISGLEQIKSNYVISLINNLGQSFIVKDNNGNVDISSFEQGSYIVKISHSQGVSNLRLIIAR